MYAKVSPHSGTEIRSLNYTTRSLILWVDTVIFHNIIASLFISPACLSLSINYTKVLPLYSLKTIINQSTAIENKRLKTLTAGQNEYHNASITSSRIECVILNKITHTYTYT